jgi:BirA family transcriptional regulator, biotin operon repressor / biotin---[acetyl-CoA-carboxylase] ligase
MTTWFGKHRIDLDACGSTNDEAARFARAGASHGTIVVADEQTAGRGRDGRSWRSPRGNLYMSAVVRPPIGLEMVPPLTLAIGIGVCDAIRASGVMGQLKWPNDVLVDGRKIAGVLVEAQSQGSRLDSVIVGIGLNVAAVPAEVSAIATSLEGHGGSIDREVVIERVCTQVERWIDRYVAIGLASVIDAWQSRMAVGLMARADQLIGELIGLDVDGAVLLRDSDGEIHRVRSGAVDVIRAQVPDLGGSEPHADPATTQPAC